jgi:hypothetical protein
MTLLISDANILIDIDVGSLLEEMFRLPEEFAVPDVLYVEELQDQHAELPGYGLLVLEMPEEVVTEVVRLGEIYRQPGQMDLYALALAKHEQCPLLTGDRRLRIAAEQEHVEVRGTIWLVERLYETGIIDIDRMEQAYESMRHNGRRLPWTEIKRRLRQLK